ncbi:MAG: transporter [Alphaproteobacteria bacterium]|nr:transporter [Alphaproteobacteria bacterium]
MKKLFAVSALLLTSTLAQAGGYQLQEYSTANMGRAFAGAGIVGDDYSAIAFNPAGMELKNDGLQMGVNLIKIHSVLTGSLSTGKSGQGEIRTHKALPHFFGQKRINDRWTVGAGFYTPFGMGTYYTNKQWFAANHAINSEITTMDLALASSYKLTDTLTVGGSVFAEYMEARLTSRALNGMDNDLNANDNTAPGYTLGLMYRPTQDTRFGITYRSKTTHKIRGPHYIDNHPLLGSIYGMVGTKLVMPEHVLLSAHQKVGKFGLSASARWTRWSRFDKLDMDSSAYYKATGSATSKIPTVNEDWKNAWMIGVGVDYYHNENWTFRAGVAHDEGAVKRPVTRTARIPDSNRWLTTIGASYKSGNWQLDLSYGHMFWKKGRMSNEASGTTLNGEFKTGLDLAGVSLQYNF